MAADRLHSARRVAQRDVVHRASVATQPMGRYAATLRAGRLWPLASLACTCGGVAPRRAIRLARDQNRHGQMVQTYRPLIQDIKKGREKTRPFRIQIYGSSYAASVSSLASASTRARSLAPRASTSRSTNSITASGALSPLRNPARMIRR